MEAPDGMSFELIPPQDLEAEQSVLGAMMFSRDAIRDVTEILAGSEFYRPAHEIVFHAILAVDARGQEQADPITVAAELKRTGEITRAGGPGYIHQLVQAVPTAAMAASYAQIVARLAARREGLAEARAIAQALYAPAGDETEILEGAVERFRAIRDRGPTAEQPAKSLREFLAEADDEPEWVVPNVLARWDRLLVTAPEGRGKSLLIRQLLARTAAGLHPWRPKVRIAPQRTLLVDVENSATQVRPWLRSMHQAACAELGGSADTLLDNLDVKVVQGGLDLHRPGDRARLLRLVERSAPDLVAVGPLYKLAGGNPSDEETARVLMSALEAVRVAADGAALLVEAHSPHRSGGEKQRDFRPIGSSLWLRWPEFGFGMAPVDKTEVALAEEKRLVRWQPWRGSRSEREWPEALMRGASWPWQAAVLGGGADGGRIPAESVTVPAQTDPDLHQATRG